MDIKNMGSGVWLFDYGDLGEMRKFPESLVAFKIDHPDLRVTAIVTHDVYNNHAGELTPRGYVVNTEEK
jgi:hypothetical protein